MAERPIFVPDFEDNGFFFEKYVKFTWFSGYANSQKQKSIQSLHNNAKIEFGLKNILEISTKSESPLGVALSAFNLFVSTNKVTKIPVEAAYQSSKVFELGGPYTDLKNKHPYDIKKDHRLRESGNLRYFKFNRTIWELEPKTAFYDWLYIKALTENSMLANKLLEFDAFTDIAFNPEFSLNCQARAAAIFVSLKRKKLFNKAIMIKNNFIKLYNKKSIDSNEQLRLFND